MARVTAQVLSSGQLRAARRLDAAGRLVPLPDGNVLLSYLESPIRRAVQRGPARAQRSAGDRRRLKSEFHRQVSYELRTPLNAIIGSPRSSPPVFRPTQPAPLDYSRGISTARNRLLSLITTILDLATIGAAI